MSARIAGFVTRAASGLRGPVSVSRNITPANGGVAVHYGGPRQPAADSGSDHAKCVSTWRGWQNYHMDTHGWSDIAYTGGFCQHGYAFAGRGAGVRTAANGTNAGNQNFYAAVWIGGDGQTPTPAALDALEWWVNELRNGGAGRQVRPHRYFKSTGCPGDPLVPVAASLNNANISKTVAPVAPAVSPVAAAKPAAAPLSPPSASYDVVLTKRIQTALEVTADGIWGPGTDARAMRMRAAGMAGSSYPNNVGANVKDVQVVVDVNVDGLWGPATQAGLGAWVKSFQGILGVSADGAWGPRTDSRFVIVRKQNISR